MQCLGLDLGTSGIRGMVLDGDDVIASEAVAIRPDRRRDPHALQAAILTVLGRLPLGQIGALAVAGTSGTLLGVGRGGDPVGTLSLYNDAADPAVLAALEAVAPAGSPARGYSSALARACVVAREPGVVRILHEADWIAGTFSGRFDTTDENNALKTGYDPVARRWPDWIGALGLAPNQLPKVLPPGEPVGPVCPSLARRIGLRLSAMVASGTTDGCASFLSAGARVPGDGATALGSTLTLKILSTRPICAPEFGVYSHRLWDNWLAGGASNAGGAVLAAHFDPAAITALSERIDPEHPTGLGYYPLLRPGERFPVNDPAHPPCLTPRPEDDALFLQGMLEGIARIEAQGYRLLTELGAPPLARVTTLGGGAANVAWSRLRAKTLGVPVQSAPHASAAHGAALLARRALAR